MTRRQILAPAVVGALVAVAVPVAGGFGGSSPTNRPTPHVIAAAAPRVVIRAPATRSVAAAADPVLKPLRGRYRDESVGPVAHATLSRVAHDSGLLAAVRSGSDARIRAYVHSRFRPVWYHWHVSRVRISRGATTVIETGVPFVVRGPSTTLRDTHGRALARVQISIQDVVGFVRLNARHNNVVTVVRGTNGHVRSSLRAATRATLPTHGSVTIAGRRYAVHYFTESGWVGEPLRIWILR